MPWVKAREIRLLVLIPSIVAGMHAQYLFDPFVCSNFGSSLCVRSSSAVAMAFARMADQPRHVLWRHYEQYYNELLLRARAGSNPLAPPQGTTDIPSLRIVAMDLGGTNEYFKASRMGQLQYQVDLIRKSVRLIHGGQHIVVLTELNEFWFKFIQDKIPGWRCIHDGRECAIMYDVTVCTCIDL